MDSGGVGVGVGVGCDDKVVGDEVLSVLPHRGISQNSHLSPGSVV